ncbi:anti-sigma factor [Paraburkholderia sp. SIMBA_049]
MNADETVLIAYVDGTLPYDEREAVEKWIDESPDVAACVARLDASRLPYREAFAQQKLPPVPDSLVRHIEALSNAFAKTDEASPTRVVPVYPTSANDASPPLRMAANGTVHRPLRRVAPGWLAVAFIAGAFCLGGALRYLPGLNRSDTGGPSPSPWVQAAADYIQLYSRDTVAGTQLDPNVASQMVSTIRNEDALPLRVPDLRPAGLTFVQLQRLRFHGKPLIQLVYLPEKGEPVALCLMKQPGPDMPISRETVSGLNIATWRQGELGYALITASRDQDLVALGRQIAERGFDQLLGHLAVNTLG